MLYFCSHLACVLAGKKRSVRAKSRSENDEFYYSQLVKELNKASFNAFVDVVQSLASHILEEKVGNKSKTAIDFKRKPFLRNYEKNFAGKIKKALAKLKKDLSQNYSEKPKRTKKHVSHHHVKRKRSI